MCGTVIVGMMVSLGLDGEQVLYLTEYLRARLEGTRIHEKKHGKSHAHDELRLIAVTSETVHVTLFGSIEGFSEKLGRDCLHT